MNFLASESPVVGAAAVATLGLLALALVARCDGKRRRVRFLPPGHHQVEKILCDLGMNMVIISGSMDAACTQHERDACVGALEAEFGFATERLRPLVQYMKQKDVDFVEKLVDNLNPLFNRNNVELITILRPQ